MMPLADEGLLQSGTNSHNHILWELAKLRAAAPGASVFLKLAREIFLFIYVYITIMILRGKLPNERIGLPN